MTTHSPSISDIDVAIQLNPQLDVEALLLSAALYSRDTSALSDITAHLSADHFNNPHYGRLFDTISDLVKTGRPHDPASVRGALIKQGGEQHAVLEALVMATTLGANDLEVKHFAAEVSSQAYRRSYHALATSIEHAASAAPEAQLFDILVEHGRAQRALWQQHQHFCAEMGTTAAENHPKESVRDDTASRTDSSTHKAVTPRAQKMAQGMSLVEVAGVSEAAAAAPEHEPAVSPLQDPHTHIQDAATFSHLSPVSKNSTPTL